MCVWGKFFKELQNHGNLLQTFPGIMGVICPKCCRIMISVQEEIVLKYRNYVEYFISC